MDGFPFVHRETVRFRDVDAWGHVNNAVFLTYCEQARMAFLADLGLVKSVAEARMILARAEIDFRSQASVGETIAIGVRPSRFGRKSFDLEYRLEADGRLVAESRSVLVAYDYDRQQSIELPESWRRRLAA